jgi:hypothetical protein
MARVLMAVTAVAAVVVWALAAAAEAQERPAAPPYRLMPETPGGFAGQSLPRSPRATDTSPDFVPIIDRWRLGIPTWDRYERPIEAPFVRGRWWDPYNQSVIKGDYPIIGNNIFMALTAVSDTLFEARTIPTPSNVVTIDPDSAEFFGSPEQRFLSHNFILSLELFKGATAFRPRDWEFRITGVFNFNYLEAAETGVVNIDPSEGKARDEDHASLQEFFVEYHLGDLSPQYDFLSARVGIQGFTSDFRGFIFSDNQLGARLFGNLGSNQNQFNAVYFRPLEKDTNSGLNRLFDTRRQHLGILNYFRQDFLTLGYTLQLSAHYLHDAGGTHRDENGFPVRPSTVGTAGGHVIDAVYLGWTGDGHIGPLNVTHAFYQVVGRDSRSPISDRSQDISAQMAALELSVDFDWFRPKFSFLWASGDRDPLDNMSRGFDSIFDNPNFAGGAFSYWVRQGIPLTGTGVELVGRNSLVPSLRSSKIEGQPSYVNPGLFLIGAGADIEITPRLRASLNVNHLRFHHTESLELLLLQDRVRPLIGTDYSLGFRYRPLLIDNVILTAGGGAFVGGAGFRDIYSDEKFVFGENGLERVRTRGNQVLYSAFMALTLTF